MEEDKKTPPAEEESDFSYLAKLSEAYKRTQAERRKLELNEEKRAYLTDMQRELAAIGRAMLTYYEREEKKELAAFILTNAEKVLHALSEDKDALPEAPDPSFHRAVLLANRSLNTLSGGGGYGDISHMILSELSAIYALAMMG